MRRTPLIAALGIATTAALMAGCGDDDSAETPAPGSIDGVGVVPPTLVASGGGASASRTELDAAPGPDHRADGEPDVATAIDSNHVIVVGDSLMESTTVRYGASMCKSLVPRGWAVETIAETGQHVDFGLRVIDERFDPDWDVAVVMLGNNYRGNQQAFEEQLDQIIQRLTLRPTVMFTVTEFEPAQADVNESIWRVADRHDNVMMIDWNAETAADPSLLAGDGLHLTDAGKNRLAGLVGELLGQAPEGSEGDCLDDGAFDDSISSVPPEVTIPPSTTTPPTTSPATVPSTTPPTTSLPPASTSPTTSLPSSSTLPPSVFSLPPFVPGPPPTYVVQPGDSLEEIAIEFGSTVDELAAINGIADVNQLSIGQVLELPRRDPPPTTAAAPTTTLPG